MLTHVLSQGHWKMLIRCVIGLCGESNWTVRAIVTDLPVKTLAELFMQP